MLEKKEKASAFSVRVREDAKEAFQDLAKEYNLSQAELMDKLLLAIDVEELKETVYYRRMEIENFDRMLDKIREQFCNTITTNVDTVSLLKEKHEKEIESLRAEIREKDSLIEELRSQMK